MFATSKKVDIRDEIGELAYPFHFLSSHTKMHLLGQRTVVIELTDAISLENQQRIWGLLKVLEGHELVSELVPGMNNLSIILKQPVKQIESILAVFSDLWLKSQKAIIAPRVIEIPVHYGHAEGPDLEFVAHHANMTAQQVIELHSSITYTVFFLGFKPGFPYLGGLPNVLATPRKEVPRLVVPSGSVGIGGSQTGIYPTEAPGGWQLIGRTNLSLFDPTKSSPTLLQPGDSLKFIPVR